MKWSLSHGRATSCGSSGMTDTSKPGSRDPGRAPDNRMLRAESSTFILPGVRGLTKPGFGVSLGTVESAASRHIGTLAFAGGRNPLVRPANQRRPWTPVQVKGLRQLAKGNTPTRVIALKLGRSAETVRSKASEQGVSLKPPNQSPYGPRSAKGQRRDAIR